MKNIIIGKKYKIKKSADINCVLDCHEFIVERIDEERIYVRFIHGIRSHDSTWNILVENWDDLVDPIDTWGYSKLEFRFV